jgi:uncharacterized protein YfiM (DUF2279 family)
VKKALTISCSLLLSISLFSQVENDSLLLNKKKIRLAIASQATVTSGTLIALNEAWYKDFPRAKFHSFNDNEEWLQMDKAGHIFSAYHIASLSSSMYAGAGVKGNKAIYAGAVASMLFLSGIEFLDAYSAQWGFSWGDMAANTLGAGVFVLQNHLKWKEHFTLKFSFSESGYAPMRPNLLGKTLPEQILKDYNGQSYWLSINPSSIFKINPVYFPRWLNFAFGYSGDGMIAARSDQSIIMQNLNLTYYFKTVHSRQFYFSLDIDLRKIPVKNKTLKSLFSVINIIKIPAPALQLQNNKFKFIPIYY